MLIPESSPKVLKLTKAEVTEAKSEFKFKAVGSSCNEDKDTVLIDAVKSKLKVQLTEAATIWSF